MRNYYYLFVILLLILKLFPQAKFQTLNTGHWVQAENPQEFTKTVLTFLKD